MYYGNAEDFQTYLTDRGFDIPGTWSDEMINSALLVASEWLDNHYEDSWIGWKVTFNQERSWPRQNAMVLSYPSYTYSKEEIPVEVEYATYELAKRELLNKGCLTVDYKPTIYNSVSVYNAVTVEYNPSVTGAGDTQLQIPAVQNLMSKLIDTTKGGDYSPLTGRAERV